MPLVITGMVLWVHLYEFSATLQWDSYIYVIIGKYVARGLLPYRDLWEMKPPGIFWYLGGVFSVLPVAMWSVRIADFFLYTGAAAAFYRVCRLEASRPVALAGTGLWVYFAHHPAFNVGGVYTEEYTAICAVLALAAAVAYWKTGRLAAVWLSGLLTACAILCKHPGGAVALPILIVLTGRPSFRAFAHYVFATAVPLALTVAYFWYHGALAEFLHTVVWVPLSYGGYTRPGGTALWPRLAQLVTQGEAFLRQYPVIAAALVVGIPVCVLRPTRLRLAVLAWLLLDIAGVAVQAHYYAHQLIPMFPSSFATGTLGAAWWVQPRPAERWIPRALRVALVTVVIWWSWPSLSAAITARQPVVRGEWSRLLSGPASWKQNPGGEAEDELGAYIRNRTAPNDRLHLYAWSSTSLGVYWAADRTPACRYFYPLMVYGPMFQEQIADLERTQAAYVVISADIPPYNGISSYVLSHYSVETLNPEGWRAEVWVRNHVQSFSSGTTVGLDSDSAHHGLGLQTAALPSAQQPLPARGTWTSPVVRLRSDDGKVFVDWNPRADVAANYIGWELPRAEASYTFNGATVEAVLGTPTETGYWSSWPRTDPQTVTVDLGFPVRADAVVLTLGNTVTAEQFAGLRIAVEAGDDEKSTEGLRTIAGQWVQNHEREYVYRFAPQQFSRLRFTFAPTTVNPGMHVQRIHVVPLDMGVLVRYRTGPHPDLTGAAWQVMPDSGQPAPVAADRYVQVQCELWSGDRGVTPVLRYLQVGRERFQWQPEITH